MAHSTFHDFVSPDADIGDGVIDVVTVLEDHGWYPRGLLGSSAVRYWPDYGRPQQIVVDYKQFVVEQRLRFLAEHTGISELLGITQEKVDKQ